MELSEFLGIFGSFGVIMAIIWHAGHPPEAF